MKIKKFLYIFLALIVITATETGIKNFLPDCGMACCQNPGPKERETVAPSCCSSPEIETCNCKFQIPIKNEAEQVPRTELRISVTHTVFEKTGVKCSFCIAPVYKYGFKKDIYLYYIVSESDIFSGRAPPFSV